MRVCRKWELELNLEGPEWIISVVQQHHQGHRLFPLFLVGLFGLLEWLPSLFQDGCCSSSHHLLTHAENKV